MIDSGEVAAARRALGRSLAAYREAAGYSQHALAPLVHYGRSTIANVETGRQNVPQSFWNRCDEVLGAGGALLEAYEQLAVLVHGQRQATALDATRSYVDDDGAGAEPSSVAEVIGRFSMPLSMVERMERLAFEQVARYPHTAPPEMWPVVRRELVRVRQALDRHQAVSVQLRLTKVAGVLAGVAGNLSVDVGRRETALEYFDLSRLAGRESGDVDLTAWAIALESIDSFFNGHVGRATELLDQAAALSHRGSSARRRAWIDALRARAYAVKRDSVNACSALDRAMSLMRDVDAPSGSDFFDQERLDGMAGTTYLYLGDTSRALELIENALDRRSSADSKGRALLALDKAACWARADQPESAFEAIHTALDLAQGQIVQPISIRAREVVTEMSRWSATVAGRSCRERLRDLGCGS
jgi:tetratricopeptide (TPR) repeat protein